MIQGIGVDLIEIRRVEKAMLNPNFLLKLFSKNERILFEKKGFAPESVAGRFAAKEAILKALGLPLSLRRMGEIEILQEQSKSNGRPLVYLSGECAGRFGAGTMHVSISHEKRHSLALAIWEE